MNLQRTISSGVKYNSIMPKSNCTPTDLPSGDTSITMQLMKEWVNKHYKSVARLATNLQGKTLDQTISNIHTFLYNHFQYQADSSVQHLYSPACAWKRRKQGIDCKSYSILASSILMNLKIPHKFRRIKQPYFNSSEWTHVYVVIPDNKKEKVIDATVPTLQEVPSVAKDDLTMYEHQGLNGVVAPQQVDLFEQLVNELRHYGNISEDSINNLRNVYESHLSNGITPVIKVTDTGFSVNGINVPLQEGLNGIFGKFVANLFPKHTLVGKILGSTRSGKGILFHGKKKQKNTTPTATQQQRQVDYSQQLADQQRKFDAQIKAQQDVAAKAKEEAAKKKKTTMMIVGGVAGVLVIGGVVIYATRKKK